METLVIAIGGNAITKETQKGTFEEQLQNINESMEYIVDLLAQGYQVVLTHGNGPQVGNLLLQNDSARHMIPPQPLDICVSNTQGQIGDMISRCLRNTMRSRNLNNDVIAVLTHVEVDKNDRAFQMPSKPIGPFYSREEAERLAAEKHYAMVEDSGRGYRRVVASPTPKNIVEQSAIKKLARDSVVIAAGGGGIPVCFEDGMMVGLEAVIDKDFSSSLLASQIDAERLIILTGVKQVAIHYGTENQRFLSHMTVREAKQYYEAGEFPKGSMGPKIEAAVRFLENGGKQVIITSISNLSQALSGRDCTEITPDHVDTALNCCS